MMIRLSHGMFLPDGVSIDNDAEAAIKQPVQTCDPNGCYVVLPIDNTMLKALRIGKDTPNNKYYISGESYSPGMLRNPPFPARGED